MPGTKRSRSSSEKNGTGSSENVSEQQGRRPVASTSAQLSRERVITFIDEDEDKPWGERINADRFLPTISEQRERNQGASTSTQFQPEVERILEDEIHDVEMENTELAQSPPQKMDVTCSTSAAAKKSTPSVERSKRKRDSSNGLSSEVHDMTQSSAERREMSPVVSASTEVQIEFEAIASDEIEDSEEVVSDSMDRNSSSSPSGQQPLPSVRRSKRVSTMISKEIEKYFEGCLVMILQEGFPVSSGMIRKPDVDPLNPTRVGSGQDEYIREKNGVFSFYVQYFEEPTTLKWLTISNLELFDAGLERGVWWDPDRTVIVNFKIGVKMAIAASKYSVEERLRKFTLPVGTSVRSLLTEIENSQPTTNATRPEPPISTNDSTAQYRDESTTHRNVRSCPDSVEIMKKRISEYHQKLRDECNRVKDEEIKRLTTDKENLEATVKEQAKMIAELQEEREKEKQEKLTHKEELEKMHRITLYIYNKNEHHM